MPTNKPAAEKTAARTPERTADPAGKAENRGRLREILGVLARHEIVKGLTPEKLRRIVEELGPTFVKLGQLLSMRPDMLPAAYCRELEKLRTDAYPLPFEEVRAVVEEEYGARLETVFSRFEKEPLGSASIAQAHAAVLKSGARVVVKVQRPGIRDTMARDVALLHKAVRLLKLTGGAGDVVDFHAVLNEMWFAAQQEMDFLIEARHMEEFAAHNREAVYIACPAVEHRYTTARVLVMEYVGGLAVDDLEGLKKAGYDPREIGVKLADNYVKQIIEDGFFHADPHPGNLRVRGGQIVWLDFGMMGRLSQRDKRLFRQAVRAIAEKDVSALKDMILTIGIHDGPIHHARLYGDIDGLLTQYGGMGLAEMNFGRMLEEFLAVAQRNGIAMPEGITMLSRGALTIQGVLAKLDPDLNVVEIMANRLSAELLRDLDVKKELKEGGKSLLVSARKAADIPAQLSDLLNMSIKGQAKMNLELTGSEEPLAHVDRMVNRLALSLLAAALLVGSSLLCTTDMQPKVLGIPLLGAAGYLISLALAGYLLAGAWKNRKR